MRVGAILLSVVFSIGCLTACGDSSGQTEQPLESSTSSTVNPSGNLVPSSGVAPSSSQDAAEVVSSNAAINEEVDKYRSKDATWSNVQVYNGEIVHIWRDAVGKKNNATTQNIYMLDSKQMWTLLASEAPADNGAWFYTYDGYCLNANGGLLNRVEPDGTVKYSITAEGGVRTIVQLDNGTIVLLMKDGENDQRLAVLDGEKGEYKIVENVNLGKDNRVYIGADAAGLLVMNREGFWDVNLDTGEMTLRIPMSEYDYTIEYGLRTFKMSNGTAQLLSQEKTNTIIPIDIEKYRTVVELFSSTARLGEWMRIQVENFNSENPYYYVKVVGYGAKYGIETEEELLKAMEAGEGPDLFYGFYCFDNVHNIIDAGYLEDLVPYMSESGIYEEDYFSTTFENYKRGDAIYAAPLLGGSSGLWISEEVLGSGDIPDMEQLVDALIAYTEPSVLDMSSNNLLKYFISASESLCYTVDWENGTCDFNSNLFSKILEVSKLYGTTSGNLLPVVGDISSTHDFYNYVNKEQLELGKKVYIGYYFDEGTYPAASFSGDLMYINKNAANKDGAWALIADLLGEQSQMQIDLVERGMNRDYVYHQRYFPVNIYAYDMVIQTEIAETALIDEFFDSGRRFTYKGGTQQEWEKIGTEAFRALYSITEKEAEEMLEQMYVARSLPIKTLDLRYIIQEEAALYFSDERSLGDTCDAIQKRAQEYLDSLK